MENLNLTLTDEEAARAQAWLDAHIDDPGVAEIVRLCRQVEKGLADLANPAWPACTRTHRCISADGFGLECKTDDGELVMTIDRTVKVVVNFCPLCGETTPNYLSQGYETDTHDRN